MESIARLLLPFTGGINVMALNYATQLAEQRGATLVPLALVATRPGKGARLEHIQQAQDFLELTRRKAERLRVPIEPMRIHTRDAALSIEALAGEMDCEAVLLFLCNTEEILLGHAEIRALMDNSACNMHIILLPEKRGQRVASRFPRIPFLRRISSGERAASSGESLQEQAQKTDMLVYRIMETGNSR